MFPEHEHLMSALRSVAKVISGQENHNMLSNRGFRSFRSYRSYRSHRSHRSYDGAPWFVLHII